MGIRVLYSYSGAPYTWYSYLSIKTTDCVTVNLDLIYDQAYALRYSTAVENIKQDAHVLRDVYISRFNIWVEFDAATAFSSYMDTNCSTSPTHNCTHADDTLGYELYNSNCIYGEYKDTPSVISNLTICDGCKSVIEANRNRYNHAN